MNKKWILIAGIYLIGTSSMIYALFNKDNKIAFYVALGLATICFTLHLYLRSKYKRGKI